MWRKRYVDMGGASTHVITFLSSSSVMIDIDRVCSVADEVSSAADELPIVHRIFVHKPLLLTTTALTGGV
jgi:hypothetical protein